MWKKDERSEMWNDNRWETRDQWLNTKTKSSKTSDWNKQSCMIRDQILVTKDEKVRYKRLKVWNKNKRTEMFDENRWQTRDQW